MSAMQAEPAIRSTTPADIDSIVALYKAVGSTGDGLARSPDEVTVNYVTEFVSTPNILTSFVSS